MLHLKLLLLFGWIVVSTALKQDGWVILPNVKPDDVDYTESPFWDYRKNLLYFLAPSKGLIYSLDPTTNATQHVEVDMDATFIQPTENPDCIVYGVENKIKTVEWDGKGDKKGGKTLAEITDAGSDAKIIAGAVSYAGNLTIIVKGKSDDNDTYSVYTMMLDKSPFKLRFYRGAPVGGIIDSLFWTCSPQYLYIASSVNSYTFQCKIKADVIEDNTLFGWGANWYHPVGESKQDTTGLWYQLMYYSNNANGDVTQVSDKFHQVNYFVSSVKKLTSSAWGGEALGVFYLTTQKTDKDTDPAAGGLLSCSTIGATGRPAFIAVSSSNQGLNYCETPKPELVIPTKAPPTKPGTSKCFKSKCGKCRSKAGKKDGKKKPLLRSGSSGFSGFGGGGVGGFGSAGFGGFGGKKK